jgi:predicted HD phosphohydrolase
MTHDELVDCLVAMAATPGELDGLSELDHALQCAELLARRHPHDTELQIAGLVHDVGHRDASDAEHGRAGAELVRPVLGERVAALVEAHIGAKRYLVVTEPGYDGGLSALSRATMALQGGPFTAAEIAAFAASPWALDAVALRRADDAAKVPGYPAPGLEDWIPVLSGRRP